jgi:hypothetical protein
VYFFVMRFTIPVDIIHMPDKTLKRSSWLFEIISSTDTTFGLNLVTLSLNLVTWNMETDTVYGLSGSIYYMSLFCCSRDGHVGLSLAGKISTSFRSQLRHYSNRLVPSLYLVNGFIMCSIGKVRRKVKFEVLTAVAVKSSRLWHSVNW